MTGASAFSLSLSSVCSALCSLLSTCCKRRLGKGLEPLFCGLRYNVGEVPGQHRFSRRVLLSRRKLRNQCLVHQPNSSLRLCLYSCTSIPAAPHGSALHARCTPRCTFAAPRKTGRKHCHGGSKTGGRRTQRKRGASRGLCSAACIKSIAVVGEMVAGEQQTTQQNKKIEEKKIDDRPLAVGYRPAISPTSALS